MSKSKKKSTLNTYPAPSRKYRKTMKRFPVKSK